MKTVKLSVEDKEKKRSTDREYVLKNIVVSKPRADLAKLKALTLADIPYIMPEWIPVGGSIEGKLVSCRTSKKYDGVIMRMENAEKTFLFPVTGTIRNTLAPDVDKKDAKGVVRAMQEYIDEWLVIVRGEDFDTGERNPTRDFQVFVRE